MKPPKKEAVDLFLLMVECLTREINLRKLWHLKYIFLNKSICIYEIVSACLM